MFKNTEHSTQPMILGRALKSTVLIMGELGSIGSDVLKAHNVFDIDVNAWYPAKLRQEIHEAAYRRFGSAALLNFGFSMGDHYSQDLITASLQNYQSLMADASTQTDGLDWFVQNFAHAYHVATNASQNCEGVDYGFHVKRISDGCYVFNAVSTLLSHHQAFSEGIIHGYLMRFISHQWTYELTFHPEQTESDECFSSFHWTCVFKPQLQGINSAEEATAAYKLQIKETLFKKVLNESNSSLATLMSSVRYARLIQQSQLPHAQSMRKLLKDFTVEWHPRDTIGGDFWWAHHHAPTNTLVLALVDCAGHGVPGAMLAVLVNSQLEKIFSNPGSIDLSEAILQLDQLVRKSLRQDLPGSDSDDGCDAALIRIDLTNRAVEYVGAKINLFELNAKGEVEQRKADRISLGYRDTPRLKPTTQQWTPALGSRLVLVTDGVTDQMGGGKQPLLAFGYKRMLAVLQASSSGNTAHLSQQLLSAVTEWQGTQARRDDVTILALEI